MLSTMPDFPLTTAVIFSHGRQLYSGSEVITYRDGAAGRSSFGQVATTADRLTAGLQAAGLRIGDRVGTLCWNTDVHLAAYLAVPCAGGVLHTVNPRLSPAQLRYVIDHAGDRFVLVDASLVPLLAEVADDLRAVERFVVVADGDGGPAAFGPRGIALAEFLAAVGTAPAWPELDERAAAALCYTSGTTGHPRGVAYGHRSTFVHSMAACTSNTFGVGESDRILLIVPMFHANAWGLPYAAWMAGADLVMPGPTLDPASVARMIHEQRPTFTAGVPTLLNDLLQYGREHALDLSSLRMAVCGGSAVPAALIDAYRDRFSVPVLQGWGMTETSPLAALAAPPKGAPEAEDTMWRAKSGRPVAGVQMRIVDEHGAELPWDGRSVGEIEVRGPWVTGTYHLDPAPEKFHDGWLRTGDVGYGDDRGYVQLTDRTKDVIKSGGEWISSVELENLIMAHPDVIEAAVIGIPDPRWDERPMACVVRRPGTDVQPADVRAFLEDKVARWWLPEHWAFVSEIPKTSVGKFDKRRLRAEHRQLQRAEQEPACG
ncbi:MAG TPA: long-chain fatty acid--CoA ligase [Solirubrobacteraceae bacterium]|nr:long-chain fatty acid--CoA ligase [Solirubrobacteraceae bacterium]